VVFARRRTDRNVTSVERSFEEIPLRWPIPGGRAEISKLLLTRISTQLVRGKVQANS
jgi:hypothetical protein